MRNLFLLVLWFVSNSVSALEFFQDGKIDSSITQGYWLQSGDTVGGYAIFNRDLVQYWKGGVGSSTGGDVGLKMPWLLFEHYSGGKWIMGHITTVTIGGNNTSGWSGDPCGGESIVKINRIRGRLDRCAVARIKPIRVAGKELSTLEIDVVETNSGGRFYKVNFNVNYEELGFSYSDVVNREGRFASDLKSWMSIMLDAVVVAAGYEKPANPFESVPPLLSIFGSRISRSTPQVQPQQSGKVSGTGIVYTLAIKWDGYSSLFAGKLNSAESNGKGSFFFKLPNEDGDCSGTYEMLSKTAGMWAVSCGNGLSATGRLDAPDMRKPIVGRGTDSKGRLVELTASIFE